LRRGTRGTMQTLRNTSWGVLLLADDSGGGANDKDDAHVRRAATTLLALLPLLAGGSFNAPLLPSKAWLQSAANGTTMLQWEINTFFPLAAWGPGDGRNGGGGGSSSGART
jgi:hypothetical protein